MSMCVIPHELLVPISDQGSFALTGSSCNRALRAWLERRVRAAFVAYNPAAKHHPFVRVATYVVNDERHVRCPPYTLADFERVIALVAANWNVRIIRVRNMAEIGVIAKHLNATMRFVELWHGDNQCMLFYASGRGYLARHCMGTKTLGYARLKFAEPETLMAHAQSYLHL